MKSKDSTLLFLEVPEDAKKITDTLEKAGFEAYFVGGCVRDLILGKKPKDWDVTTNATPEQIIPLFSKTFYENSYGTVGVVNEKIADDKSGSMDQTLKVIEVTPYRLEAKYSDNRRPDSVTFSSKIEDDLKRRDFTINAIAIRSAVSDDKRHGYVVIDNFGGIQDLKQGIVRTVGDPDERFKEDALRLLRAVRIATEHEFTIESETEKAIARDSGLLSNISTERIREEFNRIILSERPAFGIKMAQKLGILKFIIPELEQAIGVEQNQAHAYDVWEHLLRTLDHSASKKWPLDIRMAALLHDISKPETRRRNEEKKEWTFYGHDVVGSRVTKKILSRLKYSNEFIEKVSKLVRWHMFFSDTEKISLSAVRRMIRNVGQENIWDLMNVRICDRIGTGRPKEDPYRLRKYHSMIEEALRDPLTVGMLKIDGKRIMETTKIEAGPKIGHILHALLEEILDDPSKNTSEYLENRAMELSKLSEIELKGKGEAGKERKEGEEEKNLAKIRGKYWVK